MSSLTARAGALSLVIGPIAVTAFALAAGCSANVDDLFQASGGAGSTTTSGSASKGATTSTSSVPSTTTGTGQTATVSTTGPGGVTSSVSSGPSASSSTGPFDPTVTCGLGPPCLVSDGGCCYGTFQQAQCSQNGSCPNLATQILCQLPSDCPGQICCAQRNDPQQAFYDAVQCDSQCDSPSRILCNAAAPACPLLPNGQGMLVQSVCKASQLLPAGYSICSLP